MADGMYLHWTMDGKQHGWSLDIKAKPEWKCRAFLRSEFNQLVNNLMGLTRRERREWRRENGRGTITEAEYGFIRDGNKEPLESWAA